MLCIFVKTILIACVSLVSSQLLKKLIAVLKSLSHIIIVYESILMDIKIVAYCKLLHCVMHVFYIKEDN